ncbi:MAG: hypothetical protein U0175_02445 [Caldilineaceae bacterium]
MSAQSIIEIWLGAIWLLWTPGILLVSLLRMPRPKDWLVAISVQIGLGIVFWPLILLWSSISSTWHFIPVWTAWTARGFVFGIGILAIGCAVFQIRTLPIRLGSIERRWLLFWIVVFSLTIFTRLQQVEGLVLPNWVDSVHHTEIAKLIIDQGKLPDSYLPYLPNAPFSYHWGFHAVAVWLCWLLGWTDGFGVAKVILQLGQMLNSLVTLMFYAGGRLLFQNRRAAISSAVFGSLISWYPAYYVSWGRYPQLLGILLFAPLFLALNQLSTSQKATVQWMIVTILLLSGAMLVHIRTFFFTLCLIVLLLVHFLFKRQWNTIRLWGIAGVFSLCMVSPWLYHLAANEKAGILLFALPKTVSIGANQQTLFWVPGIDHLILLASGGLGMLIKPLRTSYGFLWFGSGWFFCFLMALCLRVRQGNLYLSTLLIPFLILIGWSLVVFFSLIYPIFGLPGIGVVSLDSAIITFFVPLVLFAGGIFAWVIGSIVPPIAISMVTITLLLVISLWGAKTMRTIVNPMTILATKADVVALHWIKENLPANAKFAPNAYLWEGATYAGTDGGYWIPVLTDRETILPPLIYTTVLSRSQAISINQVLERWSTVTSIDDPNLRQWLKQLGVSYFYLVFGKGGLQPMSLFGKDYVELLYYKDDIYIFRLR